MYRHFHICANKRIYVEQNTYQKDIGKIRSLSHCFVYCASRVLVLLQQFQIPREFLARQI